MPVSSLQKLLLSQANRKQDAIDGAMRKLDKHAFETHTPEINVPNCHGELKYGMKTASNSYFRKLILRHIRNAGFFHPIPTRVYFIING